MTSDRELLELAAKAAGYVLGKHTQKDWAFTYSGMEWNPLTDDGDALRLAVRLRMDIAHLRPCGCSAYFSAEGLRANYVSYNDFGGDANSATRRAIVRAAAEIGRHL